MKEKQYDDSKARKNYWTVVAVLGVAVIAFKIYADKKMGVWK